MRLFKDALMRRSMSAVGALLSPEGEEELHRRTAEVEDAYARVSERATEVLKGEAAPTYAQVLTALRTKDKGSEQALPSRRVLVHILARLDYYFFELASGYERVHDMPYLTDEERAAEHRLRHDLFLKLYDELEPAFDISLNWSPSGYEVDEDGELVKVEAEFEGMAAIGYDYGYDAAIFHEGHAASESWDGKVTVVLHYVPESEDYEGGFEAVTMAGVPHSVSVTGSATRTLSRERRTICSTASEPSGSPAAWP